MKKTVANRRMFRQGGAVNSGPTGILASSPSLIDAVAQDAMNVQGGPTVRMADGGIVRRMANGGSTRPPQNLDERIQLIFQRRFPGRLPEFLKPPPLSKLPSPVTATEATMKPRSERLSGEELLNLSLGARTILPPEISDEIIEYPATPVRSGPSSLPPSTVMRSNIDDPVYDMETLTEEYLQGDPDNVVKEYLRSIAGTPAYGKIFSALQDAEMQAQQSGEVPTTAVPLGFEDFERNEVDTDMGPSDGIGRRGDDPTASDTVGELGEEGGGDEVSVPKTAKGPAFNEGVDTVMGPGDQELDPNAMKRRTETPGVDAEAVKQIKDAAKSGNEEETKNKLEDYINEFKSAIPEYEGKSEAEKGFDLVKMGMAVAAGESPEAITNISKGVLATIDNFTEDEKAKRAYKQQVAMSAAKYGLENVRRDKAATLALEKERRTPFNKIFNATEDFVYKGRTYRKDDPVIATVGDIQDGSFPLNKVRDQDLTIAGLKAEKARLTSNLALAKAGMSDPSKFTKPMTEYINAASQVKGNIAIQELLKQAVVPLKAGEVTGGINALQAYGQRFENLTGIKLGTVSSKEPDKYRDRLARAITANITSLLNEGNRTVSDADRRRAEEIGGLYANSFLEGAAFKDKDILAEKLQAFNESLKRNSQKNISLMNGLEETWQSRRPGLDPKGQTYTDILRARRGELSETATRTLKGGKGSVFKWSDMTDAKGNYVPNWRDKLS